MSDTTVLLIDTVIVDYVAGGEQKQEGYVRLFRYPCPVDTYRIVFVFNNATGKLKGLVFPKEKFIHMGRCVHVNAEIFMDGSTEEQEQEAIRAEGILKLKFTKEVHATMVATFLDGHHVSKYRPEPEPLLTSIVDELILLGNVNDSVDHAVGGVSKDFTFETPTEERFKQLIDQSYDKLL